MGLTDVADLVGVSRQNMRKLMVAHADAFPAPIHMGNASVWHLALVLEFMLSRRYKVAQAMVDVAQTAMRVNITKEAALVEPIDTADSRYALAA